jgi:C1A family cysteine protease
MIDLSAHLGPVRDQGNRGTCVAFAASSVHELARIAKRGQAHELLSVEALYWHAKQIEGDDEPGIYVDSAKAALSNPGQCAETGWPYEPGLDDTMPLPGPPGGAMALPARRASLNWIGVNPDGLRIELETGHGVLAVIDTWDGLFDYTGGDVEAPSDADLFNEYHAVTIVGYDDTRKAFLVRNSWGDSWGDNGHIWLPYDAWSVVGVEAYRLRDDLDA